MKQAEVIPENIFQAIFKNDLNPIIIWLGTHRMFDHMQGRSGDKLLHCACNAGSVSLAVFFIDKGANVSECDGYGETPLYATVKSKVSSQRTVRVTYSCETLLNVRLALQACIAIPLA
jgi:hypothetical protein